MKTTIRLIDSWQMIKNGFTLLREHKMNIGYSAILMVLTSYVFLVLPLSFTLMQKSLLLYLWSFVMYGFISLLNMRLIYTSMFEPAKTPYLQIWNKAKGTLRDYINLIWLGIVVGALVFGGGILLVVPGLMVTLAFIFSYIIVIIEKQNVKTALSKSYTLTYGYKMSLFTSTFLPCFIALVIVTALNSGVSRMFIETMSVSYNFLTVILQILTVFVSIAYLAVIVSWYKELSKDYVSTLKFAPWKKWVLIGGVVLGVMVMFFAIISLIIVSLQMNTSESQNHAEVIEDGRINNINNFLPEFQRAPIESNSMSQ